MALASGTKLGTFEIVALIGAGGMGEVYKARDTRLDRIVALKVLPPHWADNPEMRHRFEREAQAIASLNHPHICTLHDIGRHQDPSTGQAIDFLVMEHLEGETLAERLKRGPLELDEAFKVAIAIADALDRAHRRGVVHRDLKPSNVMLTPSGTKLLDFGLAKLKTGLAQPAGGGLTALATTPPSMTAHGTIIGTLQYMAPEQLEGLEADGRTDIFAFGAVLYEVLTGRKAFEGKSRVLLMSAIATTEPPPLSVLLQSAAEERPTSNAGERNIGEREPTSSAQRVRAKRTAPGVRPGRDGEPWGPSTIGSIEHVVKICLAKDPDDRWQTARDLLAELQWTAAGGAEALAAAPASIAQQKRNRLSRAMLAAAVLLIAAVAAPAGLYLRGPVERDEFRFRIPIQLNAQAGQVSGAAVFNPANVAVSPDGRAIAFLARNSPAEAFAMFVRPIGSVTPQRLAGTDDAAQPFWSADSRSIAFIAGGKLKKVEASGGPPQDICEVADFIGGTWNRDGAIVFGTTQGLFRVSAQGGKPSALTTLGKAEAGHFWPHFLPDGRHYLYLAWAGQPSNRAIYAGTLDAKETTRVMAAESKAVYAEPGFLLFRREDTVYAQPFNAKNLTLAGEPVRVADQIASSDADGGGSFSVSRDGVLVYFHGTVGGRSVGPQSDTADWQLAWVDRSGQQIETVGPFGPYRGVEVAPDGKRVAVHRHEANGGDLWVIEPRGSVTRLTFDASHHNSMPIWSPDGSRIVYSSLQKGKWGLYRTLSNGSGTEELLFESDLPKAPMAWTPDGKRVVFWVQDPKTAGDLWVLPLDGDKKPSPFVATPFNESHAQISPDGKWIAYTSNSTSRNEIYVQPFPSGSGRWQVSTNGGDWPRWRRDGKEVFFHALGTGAFVEAMLSAAVNAVGGTFEAGSPKELVRTAALNLPHSGGDYHTYDVSADGQRFLIFELINQSAVGAVPGVTGGVGPDPAFGLVGAINWASSIQR